MQSNFTGVTDTDVKILSSLSLADLRRACQTNQYLTHICQTNALIKNKIEDTKRKVDNIINYLNKANKSITLQPYNIITFDNYHALLDMSHMRDVSLDDYEDEDIDDYDKTIMDRFYIKLITITYFNNHSYDKLF